MAGGLEPPPLLLSLRIQTYFIVFICKILSRIECIYAK